MKKAAVICNGTWRSCFFLNALGRLGREMKEENSQSLVNLVNWFSGTEHYFIPDTAIWDEMDSFIVYLKFENSDTSDQKSWINFIPWFLPQTGLGIVTFASTRTSHNSPAIRMMPWSKRRRNVFQCCWYEVWSDRCVMCDVWVWCKSRWRARTTSANSLGTNPLLDNNFLQNMYLRNINNKVLLTQIYPSSSHL